MKIARPCAVAVCCAVLIAFVSPLGFCREQSDGGETLLKMRFGGISDSGGNQNSAAIESLGRFAVDEHNKKENALLEFARVVKSKEQVVAGRVYYLTLEAVDAGKKKLYEAKVWVKPWMDFKKLEDFKYAQDVSSFTASDLGARRGVHKLGWRIVPNHDPEVRDAANHAVKTLQQRSNSLFPYELLEILLAKAEVIESSTRFQLLLKLKRGMKIEEFKVLVSKNRDGKYYVN